MTGSLLDAVCEVIRAESGCSGPLTAETDLVEDVGLDSLVLLQVTVELENRFSVCLEPGPDDGGLTRVGDIVTLLERQRVAGGEAVA